ncbi:MAG: TlpA family protein disulfide reductase [Rhodobacteraceae bacterium]|nr:TlpA family protein disulfide reductase [Paracoccaceae bacterium]
MIWRALISLLFVLLMPLVQGCDEKVEKEFAADFVLQLFNGQTFTLSKHKGEAVVVNFFASWCIPCKAEAPALEAVHREYFEKKVIFLGIAIKDTDTGAQGFVKKYALSFATGIDKEQKLGRVFGVYGLPTTFFIDGTGLITYTHSGAVTEELIKHELDKIL